MKWPFPSRKKSLNISYMHAIACSSIVSVHMASHFCFFCFFLLLYIFLSQVWYVLIWPQNNCNFHLAFVLLLFTHSTWNFISHRYRCVDTYFFLSFSHTFYLLFLLSSFFFRYYNDIYVNFCFTDLWGESNDNNK